MTENELALIEVPAIVHDAELQPVRLKDVLEEFAPSGEKVKAESIINQEFMIVRARPFESRYPGQTHAWFVVGKFTKSGKLFNTVLGGAAVVDVLDGWARAARTQPLIVTLRWNEGGKYGGYYTLE